MLFVRAANENAATRASPTKILWVELRQIHSYCIFPSASFVVNRCVHRSTDSSVGPVEEDRRNLFSPRHSLINEPRITQARPSIVAPKVLASELNLVVMGPRRQFSSASETVHIPWRGGRAYCMGELPRLARTFSLKRYHLLSIRA
jgi:hypothetical protein